MIFFFFFLFLGTNYVIGSLGGEDGVGKNVDIYGAKAIGDGAIVCILVLTRMVDLASFKCECDFNFLVKTSRAPHSMYCIQMLMGLWVRSIGQYFRLPLDSKAQNVRLLLEGKKVAQMTKWLFRNRQSAFRHEYCNLQNVGTFIIILKKKICYNIFMIFS